ncbi:EYxxD motif small membrane protein [Rossellomorea sp. BNER]|uniref:EYxxD motif small membrane protein n=1 Tax=Rossellomorea sp. BNER TaxID=2962031 RepID=UPI003AF2B138
MEFGSSSLFEVMDPNTSDSLHSITRSWLKMFWEYITDMSYVLLSLIGGIVAIAYVYFRKSKKRRAR